ncbi:MAG: aromatic amino acid transport family protein, partial [Patescibacteria group bacterium]
MNIIAAWKRHRDFFEAIAVVVGAIVGAGVLAIPYAVAQVGFGVGLLYIIGLGVVMLALHILLGEIVARTKGALQLPGLARKYLGRGGEIIMSGIFFFSIYSALLAYMIGQGEVLAALFGGAPFWWSIIFFAVGA